MNDWLSSEWTVIALILAVIFILADLYDRARHVPWAKVGDVLAAAVVGVGFVLACAVQIP